MGDQRTVGTQVRLPALMCQTVRSRPKSEALPGSPQFPGNDWTTNVKAIPT
jgi:hypothetical protein